jgi:hypothetical protein
MRGLLFGIGFALLFIAGTVLPGCESEEEEEPAPFSIQGEKRWHTDIMARF